MAANFKLFQTYFILKLLKLKFYFAKLMWGVCRFKRKIENETALAVGHKGQNFLLIKSVFIV